LFILYNGGFMDEVLIELDLNINVLVFLVQESINTGKDVNTIINEILQDFIKRKGENE